MVPLAELWLPIVLSSVLVFVASSIIHMFLPFHRGDLRQVEREDAVMDALRGFNLPPGDYALPYAGSPEALRSPAFLEKMNKGPVVLMTVGPTGPPAMALQLALWFVYLLVVSSVAAYVAGRALGAGTDYLPVFRFAGTTAFAAYALALPQNSIWWRRNWMMTLKTMLDGLVYGLLTGGVFGWLWPR
jgi:hypothetical protein